MHCGARGDQAEKAPPGAGTWGQSVAQGPVASALAGPRKSCHPAGSRRAFYRPKRKAADGGLEQDPENSFG